MRMSRRRYRLLLTSVVIGAVVSLFLVATPRAYAVSYPGGISALQSIDKHIYDNVVGCLNNKQNSGKYRTCVNASYSTYSGSYANLLWLSEYGNPSNQELTIDAGTNKTISLQWNTMVLIGNTLVKRSGHNSTTDCTYDSAKIISASNTDDTPGDIGTTCRNPAKTGENYKITNITSSVGTIQWVSQRNSDVRRNGTTRYWVGDTGKFNIKGDFLTDQDVTVTITYKHISAYHQNPPSSKATYICSGSTVDSWTDFGDKSCGEKTKKFTIHVKVNVPPPTSTSSCTTNLSVSMATGVSQSFTVKVGGVSPLNSITAKIVGSGNFTWSNTTTNLSNDTGSFSFTPPTSGTYTLTATANGSATSLSCGVGYAGAQPYFTVDGGDLSAAGEVLAFNRNSGVYQGAGAQLATLASGKISGFITGSDSLSGSNPGSRLAFANYGVLVGGTVYGGEFDALTGREKPEATTTTATYSDIDLGSLQSGTYKLNAGGSIHGSVKNGRSITIIAAGDVYVSGDIKYDPYTNVAGIPRLTVLAGSGNILVDKAVREMHGIFYADGDTGRGIFYSCALSASQPIDQNSLGSHISDCAATLNVYGMVSAKKLTLVRTSGNWSDASPLPAEVFHQGPELWLYAGGTKTTYDSYVNLPPVL